LDEIDFADVADPKELMPPVTPGEILRDDFMEPLGLSANDLAKALHVPPNRISVILKGTRSITADTALRLARYFGTTPQPWLNLQKNYELEVARRMVGREIEREVSPRAA
jgi:addiction module HigA family antidote